MPWQRERLNVPAHVKRCIKFTTEGWQRTNDWPYSAHKESPPTMSSLQSFLCLIQSSEQSVCNLAVTHQAEVAGTGGRMLILQLLLLVTNQSNKR